MCITELNMCQNDFGLSRLLQHHADDSVPLTKYNLQVGLLACREILYSFLPVDGRSQKVPKHYF